MKNHVKILDFKKYNGKIEKQEDVFRFVERLLKCSNCSKDFYDKRCPTCYNKEGFVKIEDVNSLFQNIRLMILDIDEKSHNWNVNAVAGKVYNQYLIFKKALAQKEKT